MASRIARLLCTLLLLLRSGEVISAPATGSITEVMKKELADCKIPGFLDDTAVMKTCTSLPYPKDDLKLHTANMDTFLCMGAYDAVYKLCQGTGQSQSEFKDSASFKAYVEKLYPGNTEADKAEFCSSMKDIAPVSEKAKPFVSQLSKYLNSKCSTMCFDLTEEFRPICTLMPNLRNTDNVVKTTTASKDDSQQAVEKTTNIETTVAKSVNAKPVHTVPQKDQKESGLQSPSKKSEAATSTDNEHAADIENTEQVKTSKDEPAHGKAQNNEDTAVEQQKPPEKESGDVADAKIQSQMVQPDRKEANNVEPVPDGKGASTGNGAAPQSKENPKHTPENEDNSGEDKSKIVPKVLPDDAKTSTISEDTQDHDIERQDYTRMEDVDGDTDRPDLTDQNQNMPEPSEQREVIPQYHNSIRVEEESHFFTYFMIISLVCIAGYIGYHNKQKVLAIVLEGRRSRNNRGRRRPSTASYRKLDCTLEEAVTSQCNANR